MSEILGGVMIRRVNYRVIDTTGLDVDVGVARGEKVEISTFRVWIPDTSVRYKSRFVT